jgi:ubiquinone/menaquinone biosynthesis C-methylase UbiE
MKILDSVFAQFYDRLSAPTERMGVAEQRRQLLSGLSGAVLEIGAGTGHNLAFYPDTVSSLVLTEPSEPMARRLRQHVERAESTAEVLEVPAEELPFDDASFDAVVSTVVLCSVRDLDKAVAEVRRVLKPDGHLVVLEHVATRGGPSLQQRIWDPVQHVVGRNCHVTRDTRGALERGGFYTGGLIDGVMPGAPGSMFPTISGIAVLKPETA